MMSVGGFHVADGKIDFDATALCLDLCTINRSLGKIGSRDREATFGKADGLRADAAGNVEHSFGSGPLLLYDAAQLCGLKLDALIPVEENEMIQVGQLIVELAHR